MRKSDDGKCPGKSLNRWALVNERVREKKRKEKAMIATKSEESRLANLSDGLASVGV